MAVIYQSFGRQCDPDGNAFEAGYFWDNTTNRVTAYHAENHSPKWWGLCYVWKQQDPSTIWPAYNPDPASYVQGQDARIAPGETRDINIPAGAATRFGLTIVDHHGIPAVSDLETRFEFHAWPI